jgi:8-hydroxy-5-deazaflavin:NADPH oxidoreductase
VERGEDVVLGTRSPGKLNDKRGFGQSLDDWIKATGSKARVGTFADAATHGEIVINATSGTVSLEALRLAGEQNLRGKILIDISNPLDFFKGMPPR